MKNTIRNASFALVLVALITGATVASEHYGIEVMSVDTTANGEQLVTVHTQAPLGSWVAAYVNHGNGDELLEFRPITPEGIEVMMFPGADPHNRIEILAEDGIEVMATVGDDLDLWELD